MVRFRDAWGAVLVALLACGGGAHPPAQAKHPSAVQRDAGTAAAVASAPTRDAGRVDAGVADAAATATPDAAPLGFPSNDTFDTARPLVLGDQGSGVHSIEHAAQVNYYSFQAEAGHFYDIRTHYGSFSPDTVITLYDVDHVQIAYNDNGAIWPSDDVDARLVVRAKASATYYVEVRDVSTLPGMITPGAALMAFYTLMVSEITRGKPGFAFDADGADARADAPAFLTDVGSGNLYVTVVGTLSPGGRDEVPFHGKGGQALIGHVLKPGTEGNGSSEHSASFSVEDGSGHTLARIDQSASQEQIHPPIDDLDYTLLAEAPAGTAGDDDFYAVDLVLLQDNPGERADATNDTIAGAELLMMKRSPRYERGLILAALPAGDVDYFEIDAFSGDTLDALCEGASAGSGLVDLRAEIRDPDDKLVIGATESPSSMISIEAKQIPVGGAYYVRLSAGGQRPNVDGAWARCAISIQR